MTVELEPLSVLAAYSEECRSTEVEFLGSAGGFSGALFWRVKTRAGLLCLRRWPRGHPSAERLEFIQAVLWHVVREGFDLLPLPLATRRQKGYVRHGGHFWELAPWMPGEADFRKNPTEEKLTAAMTALARFHRAALSFPLPDPPESPSPGMHGRLQQLQKWVAGDLDRLVESVEPGYWPEVEERAARLFPLVREAAESVLGLLKASVDCRVSLQPCIRDVWHDHVFFEEDRVSGLIDFGSMATDHVATDVARLLGSMACDDRRRWQVGLDAYGSVRPLSEAELSLISAFDQSTVLMAGLNWIDWIYRQRRVFDNHEAIPPRLDEIITRLEHLTGR